MDVHPNRRVLTAIVDRWPAEAVVSISSLGECGLSPQASPVPEHLALREPFCPSFLHAGEFALVGVR